MGHGEFISINGLNALPTYPHNLKIMNRASYEF